MNKEVKRFSKELLSKIEDLDMKGKSKNKIAKELDISLESVIKGLNKIFEEEC